MSKTPTVIVIGAGMSGILMGIRLKRAGFGHFTILEQADSYGGTWRANRYPGVYCDVQSHHYCYSFEPNPAWTEVFAAGAQIWQYLDRTARKYGIPARTRFNAKATSASWDGSEWLVQLASGEILRADIVVSAVGYLRVAHVPDIPGLADFAGPVFHTTQWDQSLPLKDKRIGLIGTGSTAVQITCALSGNVRHLTLFQRTAQWVAKVPNPPIPVRSRLLYRFFPSKLRRLYDEFAELTMKQTGGAIMGHDVQARAGLKQNVEDNLASVRDPELRRKLTPDHEVGCKRLVMSPRFYEAIQDPSLSLVTEAITRIEPQGVRTRDGQLHELDVLVLATGFDAQAYLRPMAMNGVKQHTLAEIWAKRPIAYRSMALPYMPNFFMIGGPFSPIGNLSLFQVSEWQADYVMKCLHIIRTRRVAMMPRADVTDRFMAQMREDAKTTIWATGGCKSWYQDEEGVPFIYPYHPARFRDEAGQDPNLDDYEVWPLPPRTAGARVKASIDAA